LVTKQCALKSTTVNVTEVPVSSGDCIVINDDVWSKLSAPEVKSRTHSASFPGQQYVIVYVVSGTGRVNPKVCRTSEN